MTIRWLVAMLAFALVVASQNASAEHCWMLGCKGMKGWVKVARDAGVVAPAAEKLFGSSTLPIPGTVVSIRRFAFLRHVGHRNDRLEEPTELLREANLL